MKVKGMTIEVSANTKPLVDDFQKANKQLTETNKILKDIDKGLKIDPSNIELLRQKSEYLTKAIDATNKKLKAEEGILADLEKRQRENNDASKDYSQQINAVKREIEETKRKQSEYTDALKDVETATKKAGRANKDMGDSFLDASLKVELIKKSAEIAAKAVGQLVKFVADSVKASSEFADTILTEATVTGLSTDALQEYYYMAELVDVSVGTITGSLTKLTKNMYAAKDGTGLAAEYFDLLGVSVTDAKGNLRDNNEVFDEVITKLGEMDNETERDAIAMGIFGKSAQELNPLIAQGADNIQAFRDEAHQMGYVLDEEALASLGAIDDALQRASVFMDAIKNQIGEALAPVIVDIAEKFTAWAQSVDWTALGEKIATFINGCVIFLQNAIPIISGIVQMVIFIFQSLWTFIQGLWDFFVGAWEGITNAVQSAKDALKPIIDGIVNLFQSVWNVVDKVITKVGDFVSSISGAINKAGEFMNGVGGRIAGFFGFGSGGFGSGGFATPSFASGGYNLSTNVTINNYSTPVSGAFADRVAAIVNDKLGAMLK